MSEDDATSDPGDKQSSKPLREHRGPNEPVDYFAAYLKQSQSLKPDTEPPAPAPTAGVEEVQRQVDGLASQLLKLNGCVAELQADKRLLHHELGQLRSALKTSSGDSIVGPRSSFQPATSILSAAKGAVSRRLHRVFAGSVRRGQQALVRLWSHGVREEDSVALEVRPSSQPPLTHPLLTVVFPLLDFSAHELERICQALRPMASSVEWIMWDRTRGSYTVEVPGTGVVKAGRAGNDGELRAVFRGAYLLTATPDSAALSGSLLETAVWLLTGENLLFVQCSFHTASQRPSLRGHERPGRFLLVRRDLWHPKTAIDLKMLKLKSEQSPGTVLGKRIGGLDSTPPPLGDPVDEAKFLRQVGPYLVAADSPQQRFRHPLLAVDECLSGSARDLRPSVLILFRRWCPGSSDGQRFMVNLLRKLNPRFRFLVATLGSHDPAAHPELEQIVSLTPFFYPLGDFLVPELTPSALHHLIRYYSVKTLILGDGGHWCLRFLPLKPRFPELRILFQWSDQSQAATHLFESELAEEIDTCFVSSASLERKLLNKTGPTPKTIIQVPPAVDLSRLPTPAEAQRLGQRLRRRLRLPHPALVVTLATRLDREARAHDFADLACRFRQDHDVCFLLSGDGPAAGQLDQRLGRLDLPNLTRIGSLEPAEVLAASDVVCITSEQEGIPPLLLAALAMGKPVVATAVAGGKAVLTQGPCGLTVPKVGDLRDFEAAIRSLKDPSRRQELASRGRLVVEKKFDLTKVAETYAQAFLKAERAPGPRSDHAVPRAHRA